MHLVGKTRSPWSRRNGGLAWDANGSVKATLLRCVYCEWCGCSHRAVIGRRRVRGRGRRSSSASDAGSGRTVMVAPWKVMEGSMEDWVLKSRKLGVVPRSGLKERVRG